MGGYEINRGTSIKITTTAYGRPAIEHLAAQISDLKGGYPLDPVTVVVRSNLVSVSTRRALAARPGGIVNVTFLTLRRLAEQIAGPSLAESGRRPVSAPLIASAIRTVVSSDPGVFAVAANHPATEQALASAYRELRAAPDFSLDAVAACSPRAADVVRIQRAARERLCSDWYDEEDLLSEASSLLASHSAQMRDPVIVHLMSSFTAGESALVNTLATVGQMVVNVGITGDPDVDDATVTVHQLAGVAVPQHDPVTRPLAKKIISASDPDDEVRAVVQAIAGWMQDGIRLGRIAVLYPTSDPYARLLQEHLVSAGVPINGTPVRNIGDMLFGRTIRNLLTLSDRGFRRMDMLSLLSNAPILSGSQRVPSRAWERVSRAAGVVRGDDWDHRLPRWAAAQRELADADSSDGLEWRAAHRQRDAERADSLSSFVVELRHDLQDHTTAISWTGMVNWLTNLVDKYLEGDQGRTAWPQEEIEAAHRVEEALDRLSGLDALGGSPPTIDLFRRTLDSELSVALPRVGRQGDGVLVGHVSVAAGMVFDRVAILGLAEGRFPPRRLEDSLLPDTERAAAVGHLQLRSQRVLDDRRDLLAAAASAALALFSHPRGDLRRSTDQPASRWLLADAARLADVDAVESGHLVDHSSEAWLTHVASFAGGLASTEQYATEQQLRLAAIARNSSDAPVLVDDARSQAALVVVRARRSGEFTRFDGNLSSVAAKLGVPEHISTTGLEAWAKCPRSFLFGNVLGVERVEEPERRFEIDPLTRGSILHKILEEFIRGAINSERALTTWTQADHARLQQIAAANFDQAEREGTTGRAILWRAERARLTDELDRLLESDAGRLADGWRPIAAELPFAEVPIALPGGHTIRMRGSIDRVDRSADGSLAVIDYKTGSASSYSDLSESHPHHHGSRLQLFVYSQAAMAAYPEATSARADYWFTKDNKLRGYPVTERVRQLVTNAIGEIATGIGAGIFPAHPSDQPTWGWVDCWFCTPDGQSDQHVRREWEQMKGHPALARYLALVETDIDDGAL
ncbi:PD-(D/E)XK nuclease family protein [Mycolicibacterium iranicum]|uniref:PD-(D/E)XK nuclease family protein n=1 Tax=Mycolicibacterium iranicum TaxID=912594 RepID=A0ABT4HQK1_MYCIR|nr:PD-(D/E)XK nuclease family protein [Mycolicibacterium iranicum]MCZ0732516.1 PD-(D/E)XK nuclease family protein [Mycolicibacterium iranicum]